MIAVIVVLMVLVVLAVLAMVFAGVGFNALRRLDVAAQESLGGIDVQLTRRADLVPSLVETVRGYAAHERSVFDAVTRARAGLDDAARAGTVAQRAAAEQALDQAIVNVLAVAENYPDLKASANFLDLQRQLTETENQLAFARQYYNDSVSTLNKKVVTIPWMLITGVAGVGTREFYQAPAGQSVPPQVQF